MSSALFFTGDKGSGKSSAIGAILRQEGIEKPAGFVTKKLPLPGSAESGIYLLHPQQALTEASPHNMVGISRADGSFSCYPQVFESLGVALLCQLSADALVLMDELGFMESQAPAFCRRVLEVLDSGARVLGALKNRSTPFLDAVRAHPNVEVRLVERS